MRNRLWQIGFMLAIMAAFLLGAVIAQQKSPPQVIKAQKFELVGQDGKPLAWLEAKGEGAQLMLFGPSGSSILLTTASPLGPTAGLQRGESEINMAVDDKGPTLGVNVGRASAILTVDEAEGVLMLTKSTGTQKVRLLTPTGDK